MLVHFHDIFLPSDYSMELIAEEHIFWTKQYLLHAYLTDNKRTQVIFASHYVGKEYLAQVAQPFPKTPWSTGGGSWGRKC